MRDYKATERAKYIEAFFRNIDWQDGRTTTSGTERAG
jgi:superoxide dismutase